MASLTTAARTAGTVPPRRQRDAGSATASAQRYRPEIDGLRAVAVVAVVLYHAELGVPGGYVGVDVFFVLSGFLIAELLWTDLRHDRFSLARFLERRARRVLPALSVLTLATLVAGWLLLLPHEYAELGRSAAAQALLAANVHFWQTTDYFARPAQQLPLLHTWSLAVEEQFYLVVPFLLLGLFRLRARRPALAAGALAAVVALSFASSVAGGARSSPWSFYLLPDRLWELLLGVVLVLLPARGGAAPGAAREVLGWLGLALVLVPAFAYGKTTPFPGLAALPPCAGTALVLWANAPSRTTGGRVLALRPLVAVGLLSYSLYLWHWPLLAFARACALGPLSTPARAGLLLAALALAALSWRFVERPLRERRVAATPRSFAAWSAAALAAMLAGGLLVARGDGLPERFPADVLAPLAAKDDRAFQRNVSIDEVLRGELVRIGDPDPLAPIGLLVWGDSHAMAALPAFDALLQERGLAGEAAQHVATAPLFGFVREPSGAYGLGADAPRFNDAVLRRIRERRIPDVVLVASWSGYRSDDGGPSSVKLEEALVATVDAVVRAGARAWVLLQIPRHPFDVPLALARSALHPRDVASAAAAPDGSNGVTGSRDPGVLQRIADVGGRVVDPRSRFLDATGERYVVTSEGAVLYADAHHLTTAGARLVLLPLLRETLVSSPPPSRARAEQSHDPRASAMRSANAPSLPTTQPQR